MKWVNLSQMILLILFVITVASSVNSESIGDKTLLAFDTAVVPILAVIIIASLVLSIVMLAMHFKKNKKQKQEEKKNEEK